MVNKLGEEETSTSYLKAQKKYQGDFREMEIQRRPE